MEIDQTQIDMEMMAKQLAAMMVYIQNKEPERRYLTERRRIPIVTGKQIGRAPV